jgi:hypothetical protein
LLFCGQFVGGQQIGSGFPPPSKFNPFLPCLSWFIENTNEPTSKAIPTIAIFSFIGRPSSLAAAAAGQWYPQLKRDILPALDAPETINLILF